MADLRSQLQQVYDDHRRLDAPLLVDIARPKEHPLHSRFEWDDSVAGERYREHQARQLIASVKIVKVDNSTGEKMTLRAFYAMPPDSEPDEEDPAAVDRSVRLRSYEPIEEIIEDPVRVHVLIGEMKRDWQSIKKKWATMNAFWETVKSDIPSE